MQQRKSKKILIYFFLLLFVGSINNINLNSLELQNINDIKIVGLDAEDKLLMIPGCDVIVDRGSNHLGLNPLM